MNLLLGTGIFFAVAVGLIALAWERWATRRAVANYLPLTDERRQMLIAAERAE